MSSPIRVMIVDDHHMVRRGLATFLRATPDLLLVGEAGNGRDAIMLCPTVCPDVILMDLHMPEMNGVEATRRVRELWPRVQVLALTSFGDEQIVREAVQAGVTGYLLKNISAEDLTRAIREAYAGRPTYASEAVHALIRSRTPAPAPEYDLTPREQEVLALMVEGLHNPEIGERLVISRSTAKAHVSHVLAKLGVSNRAEAVALAVQKGLVE